MAIGEEDSRWWEDLRKYGFVSAGGGRWYSRTLESLFVGARVFACIPNTGYVGVGTVTSEAVPVDKFTVETNNGPVRLLDLPLRSPGMDQMIDDPEKCEYVVGVAWIQTVTKDRAIWEKGMFANQNSACKLRDRSTLERLTERFGLDE